VIGSDEEAVSLAASALIHGSLQGSLPTVLLRRSGADWVAAVADASSADKEVAAAVAAARTASRTLDLMGLARATQAQTDIGLPGLVAYGLNALAADARASVGSDSALIMSEAHSLQGCAPDVIATFLLTATEHGSPQVPMARPPPPLLPLLENELQWLDLPELSAARFALDPALSSEDEATAGARTLLSLALTQQLSADQSNDLIDRLNANPGLVQRLSFQPDQLPDLVEHNPLVAIETLLHLMSADNVSEFLSVLVNMEMSLHSMEVVNRLTTAVDLPKEFVHLYITNCIHSCQLTSDRTMQYRLVRLVCVFVQSLIRNKLVDVRDVHDEVSEFCVEFAKIREAAGLYRLLKTEGE
jgi:hypothetical protein